MVSSRQRNMKFARIREEFEMLSTGSPSFKQAFWQRGPIRCLDCDGSHCPKCEPCAESSQLVRQAKSEYEAKCADSALSSCCFWGTDRILKLVLRSSAPVPRSSNPRHRPIQPSLIWLFESEHVASGPCVRRYTHPCDLPSSPNVGTFRQRRTRRKISPQL